MTERTLRWVLAGVAAIAVVYVAAVVFRGSGEGGGSAGAPESFASLTALDAEEIEEVTIGAITIRREPGSSGGWTVNDYRADSARVERLLSDLIGAEHGGIAARNPANHARLGVSPDSAVPVTLRTAAGETRDFLVGDPGPSLPSAYVRIDGGDEVHVLESDLASSVRQDLEQWRNRVVAGVDTARIRRWVASGIEASGAGSSFALERTGDGWRLEREAAGEASPADPAAVGRTIGGLRRLLAQGFVDAEGDGPGDAPEGDAGPVTRSLAALDAEGDTLAALSISGGDEDGDFRVRARGDSVTYQVSRFDISRLFPDPGTLLIADSDEAGDAGP